MPVPSDSACLDGSDLDDDFDECDVCGRLSDSLDWYGTYLACRKCRDAEEDGAADRGDWEYHQGAD